MSKTSYSAAATSDRELTEAELDVVAGGNWAWGVVIVGAILDTATDGAFSKPIGQWALNGGR
jgi:lactobin A/cerein 7B family class IIb bacteriocin